MASAGPYASLHILSYHLAPDRQPHQHPTTIVENKYGNKCCFIQHTAVMQLYRTTPVLLTKCSHRPLVFSDPIKTSLSYQTSCVDCQTLDLQTVTQTKVNAVSVNCTSLTSSACLQLQISHSDCQLSLSYQYQCNVFFLNVQIPNT